MLVRLIKAFEERILLGALEQQIAAERQRQLLRQAGLADADRAFHDQLARGDASRGGLVLLNAHAFAASEFTFPLLIRPPNSAHSCRVGPCPTISRYRKIGGAGPHPTNKGCMAPTTNAANAMLCASLESSARRLAGSPACRLARDTVQCQRNPGLTNWKHCLSISPSA